MANFYVFSEFPGQQNKSNCQNLRPVEMNYIWQGKTQEQQSADYWYNE
jgi:hypothetical protein